ncbi:hypothetical protein [Paenibacillus agilis]|uniref:Uncharacterized protein n=1 Tax=Paenibacillus agilis TaxID=3020863 RepID=A0A559IZJ3_9BACL|nr:hypothetical protein [Paenibacillus agilis]TVX93033.1 hypothetical protein FPZ44_08160 [Paenibacillus agilis]
MKKSLSRVLSLLLVVCIVLAAVPVSAAASSNGNTHVVYKDYTDLDGNIVGKQKKEFTIGSPVIDSNGTKHTTVNETISYELNDNFDLKDKFTTTTRTTIFSQDAQGNNYINNEIVKPLEVNDQVSPLDTGGHWKYTSYDCDSPTQCYLYTGSAVSFDLKDVTNAYKAKYVLKNTTNNPMISDFKLYATQANNAVGAYYTAGTAYALAIAGIAALPFAGAIGVIVAGGGAIASAYQGYSAWKDLNDAMANAYSIL